MRPMTQFQARNLDGSSFVSTISYYRIILDGFKFQLDLIISFEFESLYFRCKKEKGKNPLNPFIILIN